LAFTIGAYWAVLSVRFRPVFLEVDVSFLRWLFVDYPRSLTHNLSQNKYETRSDDPENCFAVRRNRLEPFVRGLHVASPSQ
jgi:hypothetical protein